MQKPVPPGAVRAPEAGATPRRRRVRPPALRARQSAAPAAAAPDPTGSLQLRAPELRSVESAPVPPIAAPALSPIDRPRVKPLDAERARVNMTVSRRLLDKLAQARDALSHSHPGASEETILELGLDLILERHAKRRGLVKKPRNPEPMPPPSTVQQAQREKTAKAERTRYLPAHVKRAVWKRDGGRCQWKLESGETCGSTHQIEFDHVQPVALGGASTVDNGRLLCRPHQDVAARRAYGDDWMNRYTRKGRGR